MTVLRNLPSQLILAHAPWVLGGGLIVCIVACAAAGLTLLFSGETTGLLTLFLGTCVPLAIFAQSIKRDQVIFDAVSGTVTLQRRTLFRYARCTLPLNDVRRVEVEDFGETHRPTLTFHSPTAPYPLVEAYTSGNGPRQAADIINTWLHDARPNDRKGA
ncbi:hypothetical protein [Tateyamaria pelophila]|uniref:hypothetical protein n=1 Tax=Tateyamaria pelophila TaxID=328415 RepID=UPI001CBF50BD|nr:hypothetical protein [Tateyamaria pelophila]